MNNLTLKIGDSFNLPIQFYDAITGDGFVIPSDASVEAKIINSSKQTLAVPSIIKQDQFSNAGFIFLEVSPHETQNWKVGSALLDIKLTINGQVRHSQTIQFLIEASIS